MRAEYLIYLIVLVGCSAASIQKEPPPKKDVIEPSPLPREFMGIPFGVSLEVVQEDTRELTCNPLEPDDAEGHDVLVCHVKNEPVSIGFFLNNEGEESLFVGALHSTMYSVPVMAEARYSAMLKDQVEKSGKPSESIDEPSQKKVVWADGKVVVSLYLGLDDKEIPVIFVAVTKEFWDLRFSM